MALYNSNSLIGATGSLAGGYVGSYFNNFDKSGMLGAFASGATKYGLENLLQKNWNAFSNKNLSNNAANLTGNIVGGYAGNAIAGAFGDSEFGRLLGSSVGGYAGSTLRNYTSTALKTGSLNKAFNSTFNGNGFKNTSFDAVGGLAGGLASYGINKLTGDWDKYNITGNLTGSAISGAASSAIKQASANAALKAAGETATQSVTGSALNGGLANLKNAGIGVASNIGGSLIANGRNAGGFTNYLNTVGDIAGLIPGFGTAANVGLKLGAGIINNLWGTKLDTDNINKFAEENANQRYYKSNAFTLGDLDAEFKGFTNLQDLDIDDVVDGGTFASNSAKHRAGDEVLNALNKDRRESSVAGYKTRVMRADDIIDAQNRIGLANMRGEGGGIHIKPSKRGTFTAAATKHGKSVQAFASQVLANKDNYSPAMVKKAVFARNASKWHAFGGSLTTHGSEFPTGLLYIGNGGTHEENINNGVQMGVDPDGVPNLVEEGETVYNDYVFSDRLIVPKELRNKYKLGGKITFAKASKKLAKESEERPNDPISQNGLEVFMNDLSSSQEEIRQKKEMGKRKIKIRQLMSNLPSDEIYADGGNLYADGSELVFDYGEIEKPNLVSTPSKEGITYETMGINIPKSPYPELSSKGNYDLGYYMASKGNIGSTKKDWLTSALRLAPVVGAGIGLAGNLLSKPDYSNAEKLEALANEYNDYTPIVAPTLKNYITYSPMDTDYYARKLRAENATTARNMVGLSGGNRIAGQQGLIALANREQAALGDLWRTGEEYNASKRLTYEQAKNSVGQANAQMQLQAALANASALQQNRAARAELMTKALTMRDAIDAQRGASMSANMTNLFNSLGDIGKENMARNMVTSNPALYYSIGKDGKVSYKNGAVFAKGGYLTIKKGRKHG